MVRNIAALVCIGWYIFIACVCSIGYVCLFLYYCQAPKKAAVLSLGESEDVPRVTVIRPCKGLEPDLYECLASTFQQDYPRDRLAVHFCVSSRRDAAYPIVATVVQDHPKHKARIFVEEEDDGLANGDEDEHNYRKLLGPNPKIRNMSKAYREAGKDDLIWIIDCNVWVGRGICGRMVDKLCGFAHGEKSSIPYKLVHNLPISVDVESHTGENGHVSAVAASSYDSETSTMSTLTPSESSSSTLSRLLRRGGGRLEELFLSSSHAKMYVAINTVAVAPCIVGKSTMFRRSHLDYLTARKAQAERDGNQQNMSSSSLASAGIDYFSHNICEDHLIGDLLWKSPLAALPDFPQRMRNHGLVFGDLAIQPISSMSVVNYVNRRARWLRVRKFTVPVATLVEPGTESFLCSFMGAWGLTTLDQTKDIFGDTWRSLWLLWLFSIIVWAAVDWTVFLLLHSGLTVESPAPEVTIPSFAAPLSSSVQARRTFTSWLLAWLGREALTLPIWLWAVCGGTSVTWRDGRYWVGLDMRVHEIKDEKSKVA